MDDLISRQAAIDAVNCVIVMKGIRSGKSVTAEAVDCAKRIIADNIRQLPPIQPAEPKRGHWIEADVCGDITSWECSCCHNWTGLPTGWNVKAKLWFCPKCTADMREVTT